MNYKAGDKVRATISCNNTVEGRTYTVNEDSVGDFYISEMGNARCYCIDTWKPAKNYVDERVGYIPK